MWHGLFVLLLLGYVIIQFAVKSKKRYFLYFISGCVLGFYFDIVSFANGYYSYPDFYRLKILGLPFSMTLAEGFSVAIAIYIFEFVKKHLGGIYRKKKVLNRNYSQRNKR